MARHTILGAISYMFRHQGAILGDFIKNKVQHVL